ncbi:tetratricopeptide repeat protein [candidate division KSB1 bacterium]|nr:tetratricopeptide repeat protein [candidate division KSB1 bacterium]
MKIKLFLILILLGTLIWSQCDRNAGNRKIKLVQTEFNLAEVDSQQTTTIHFEARPRRSVAVWFFQNQTGDGNFEWLQKGLTEMLIRTLGQAPSISVLSTERLVEVLQRLGMSKTPAQLDLNLAAVIAHEANVEAILVGSITKSRAGFKITVKLHEPIQGQVIKEASVEGNGLEKLFSMVDQLTEQIKIDLNISLTESTQASLAELSTRSLDAWRYFTAGMAYKLQLLYSQAITEFEQAIKSDSNFVAAYLELSRLYLVQKEPEKVNPIYRKLSTLTGKVTPLEQYRIKFLRAQLDHDLPAMIALNQKQVQQYPDDREVNLELANFNFSLSNYPQTIFYLKKVLAIDPGYKLAYNQMGYCYAYLGDFCRALTILEKYKALAPDEANPFDSLGEIHLFLGDYAPAITYFQKAMAINNRFEPAYEHLGETYLDQGEYAQALEMYQKYLAIVTSPALKLQAQTQIARIHWRLGNADQALKFYQTILAENPFAYAVLLELQENLQNRGENDRFQSLLAATYVNLRKKLQVEGLRDQALIHQALLSLWFNINPDETIDRIKASLETGNQFFQIQAKFFLILLTTRQKRQAEFANLAQSLSPKEFLMVLKELRTMSYSSIWKYYAVLNHDYFRDAYQRGVAHYQELIAISQRLQSSTTEVMFRNFLINLYLHQGQEQLADQQLMLIGAPREHQWLVCGPFDNKNGFQHPFAPEIIQGADKKSYSEISPNWRPLVDDTHDGFVNLKHFFGKSQWQVAYATIDLYSPTSQTVQFRLGSDEATKVWLNSKEIWKFNQRQDAMPDHNLIEAPLKEGNNRILLKVCNQFGDWGFYFRVTDAKGQPVPDLQFRRPDLPTISAIFAPTTRLTQVISAPNRCPSLKR